MSEIMSESGLREMESELCHHKDEEAICHECNEMQRLIASHRALQQERDEFRSLNEHHKTQFLTVNRELWEMRKERDALKAELEYHKQAAMNFIDLSAELGKERDALKVECAWAMKQLEFYLPRQLDTEGSKTFDRMRAFIEANP